MAALNIPLRTEGIRARRLDVVPHIREIVRDFLRGMDGKPIELEDFHVELLELMFEGGQYVINWPTDHGKSMVATFLFPLLSLIEDPDETHIICGANINDAKSRVQSLEREIETNTRLTNSFPWIKMPEKKEGRLWSATQFNVEGRTINNRNPSVLAASTSANDIKGRRGKLIMDDIEGADARTSPTKRQRLEDFVLLEAWRCFEDRGESARPLMVAVGTPFDPDSIYNRLRDMGWDTRRFSAYIQENDEEGNWKPIYRWPRKQEKVREARARMDKEQFAIQYRMDPTGGDPTKFSFDQLKQMAKEAQLGSEEWLTFVSLDPASGSHGRQADYAGVSVVRIAWAHDEELPEVELLEVHKVTTEMVEQIHLCAALAAKHQCPVIIETNAMQRSYATSFPHWHPETLVLQHYTTAGAKADTAYGLTILKTLIRNRRLKVPESQLDTEGVRALLLEIRDLGSPGHHDHIAASIWFVVRKAYESARFYKGPKFVNGYAGHASPQPGGAPAYRTPYFGNRAVAAYRRFRG